MSPWHFEPTPIGHDGSREQPEKRDVSLQELSEVLEWQNEKIQSCRNALLYLQLGPIYPEGWLWGKCELSSRTTETRAGWKKTFSYYQRMAANTGSRCLQWSMGTECQRERREINLSLNVHFRGYPSKMMKTAPQLYHFFPLHPLPDLHPSLLLCGPRRANLNLFHCDIAQHFCSRGSASEPGPASAASCASFYVRSPEEQLPSSGAELTDCLGLLSASSQRLAPWLQLSNPAKFDHLHTLWSKCTLQWCVTPLCLQENSRRDLEKKKKLAKTLFAAHKSHKSQHESLLTEALLWPISFTFSTVCVVCVMFISTVCYWKYERTFCTVSYGFPTFFLF